MSRVESRWTFLGVCTIVVAVEGALWAAIVRTYPKLSERAEFGNLFGGINTLFAGLAFAALVVTLLLQQRALRLQRADLEAQRVEAARQNARQERQAFEAMLVQLIGFHHTIAKEMHVRMGGQDVDGQPAFRMLADELSGYVSTKAQEVGVQHAIVVAQNGYEAFHQRYRGALDHYFRNLYHIVKFIDQSEMAQPQIYSSLLRAQLSPSELLLLFYDGLTPYGEKFKPLIEKYALLEQLPENELPIPGHRVLYAAAAYRSALTAL